MQNDSRQAGTNTEEIEITPEMVEAGVKAYHESNETSVQGFVREVFERMILASRNQPIDRTQ